MSSITAGPTQLTRTPRSAQSIAAARVRPSTPCLAATYATMESRATTENMEAMFTIDPPPLASMPQLGAHAVVDAAQVDVDDLAPVVNRVFLAADQRPTDPGDVGRGVKPAEGVDRVRDRSLGDVGICHVADEGRRVWDLARDSLRGLRLHVHDDHRAPRRPSGGRSPHRCRSPRL